MSEQSPFRLPDLYDVEPLRVRLLGGPRDGDELEIANKSWPSIVCVPIVPAVRCILDPRTGGPFIPPQALAYVSTRHVDDRGARLYRYAGQW